MWREWVKIWGIGIVTFFVFGGIVVQCAHSINRAQKEAAGKWKKENAALTQRCLDMGGEVVLDRDFDFEKCRLRGR